MLDNLEYKIKYQKYKQLYKELLHKINENDNNIDTNNIYIHSKLLGGKSNIEKKILDILSDNHNYIEILNNNNIDKFINNKLSIILFHTPQCHYCIEFKPIYTKFAKYIIDNNIDCKIGSYDCKSNKLDNDSNYMQYINGYPTILKFYNNNIELFNDDRNIENLITFSKNNHGNKSEFDSEIIKLTDKTFNNFINSPVITKSILFHRPECPYCKEFVPLYNKLVENIHHTNKHIFAEFNCNIFDMNKIDSRYTKLIHGVPTLIKIKNNKITKFEDDRTLSNLRKFLHII